LEPQADKPSNTVKNYINRLGVVIQLQQTLPAPDGTLASLVQGRSYFQGYNPDILTIKDQFGQELLQGSGM
jgi:hypothetical protein